MEEPGHLVYVNAGHPPPFLVHQQKVSTLQASGIVLGFLPDIELHRNFIFMEPGSTLVLYTDGIIERNNQKEELFGIERLKNLVLENEQMNPDMLIDTIYQEVFNFGGQSNWEDDASMLIIRRVE
jgi:serine phosphatase RsbU (regulator of sigma subunit)